MLSISISVITPPPCHHHHTVRPPSPPVHLHHPTVQFNWFTTISSQPSHRLVHRIHHQFISIIPPSSSLPRSSVHLHHLIVPASWSTNSPPSHPQTHCHQHQLISECHLHPQNTIPLDWFTSLSSIDSPPSQPVQFYQLIPSSSHRHRTNRTTLYYQPFGFITLPYVPPPVQKCIQCFLWHYCHVSVQFKVVLNVLYEHWYRRSLFQLLAATCPVLVSALSVLHEHCSCRSVFQLPSTRCPILVSALSVPCEHFYSSSVSRTSYQVPFTCLEVLTILSKHCLVAFYSNSHLPRPSLF